MLNITRHQGNENQNHSELLIHSNYIGFYEKTKDNKYWQGCGEKDCTLLV